MWKKLVTFVSIVAASIALVQPACAADDSKPTFKEGVNYEIRTDKLTPVKEIREFFSFWCGHCFSLQGDFDVIRDSFPKANFVRNPVAMLGGIMGPESQRALAVAANLQLEDVFVKELFHAMHREGKIPMDHKEMAAFMTGIGIPVNRFEQEYNSFPVIGKVAQFDKWGKDINIEAVPEILVNGKYLVIMESVSDRDELITLIDYLLNLDKVPDAK